MPQPEAPDVLTDADFLEDEEVLTDADFMDEPSPARNPFEGFHLRGFFPGDPMGTAGNISELFKREEAAMAEPILNVIRRVNPSFGAAPENASLLDSFMSGVKGQTVSRFKEGEQAQFGDILREFNVPEPLAAGGGLLASFFTPSSHGLGALDKLKPFTKTAETVAGAGKKIAESALTLTTKDPQLAKEFVSNPDKFTLNPFKQVQQFQVEKELADRRIQDLRENLIRKGEDLRTNISTKMDDMRLKFQDARNEIKNGHDESFLKAGQLTKQALQDVERSIDDRLLQTYDHTLGVLEAMKKEKGEAVGNALAEAIGSNASEYIPSDKVWPSIQAGFDKMAQRGNFPFMISEMGIGVKPKNVAVDTADFSKFEAIYNELRQNVTSGTLSIDYLQSLKNSAQDLAETYSRSGKNQLAALYSELSRNVNPAKIITSDPELAERLPALAMANKSYSEFIPKYEEAIANFAKTDANGNLVPDFGKIVRAVEGNDVAVIRKIRKAEQALQPEDRILPKVEEAVRDLQKARTRAQAEMKFLRREYKNKLADLKSQQGKILKKAKGNNRDALLAHNRDKRDQILKESRALDQNLDFIKKQEKLREIGGANFLGIGAGSLLGYFVNPKLGMATSAFSLLSSPGGLGLTYKGASGLKKITDSGSKFLDQFISRGGGRMLGRFLGSQFN